jgi:hypothetical protein
MNFTIVLQQARSASQEMIDRSTSVMSVACQYAQTSLAFLAGYAQCHRDSVTF